MTIGLCKCGCGQSTPLAKATDRRRGIVKGQPVDFIVGHAQLGSRGPRWKGGIARKGGRGGYTAHLLRGHPRADARGYVMEHILLAESALGKPLPVGAIVHHTDERKGQVDPRGLVICPNESYHQLLHQRSRALSACGNADWRKCNLCHQYDDPRNLQLWGSHGAHSSCRALRKRTARGRKMLLDIRTRFGHLHDLEGINAAISLYFTALEERQEEHA